jgi:hypothetical protein
MHLHIEQVRWSGKSKKLFSEGPGEAASKARQGGPMVFGKVYKSEQTTYST